MERMKLSKYALLPLLVSILLFIIPFFWLKPGEMDIGGDSSRLYFYDPLKYFLNSTLYSVSASGFGLVTIYYFNIPFVFLLMALKSILISSTLLISVFHGFSMATAFIFCYLIVKELIIGEDLVNKSSKINYAAIIGGLVYILSPALIDGWEHVLLPHNQIFLNPLVFYILLKYFKTSNVNYIFIALLLTFIFSPNFSIIGAPAIATFYPISILFLIFYTKLIMKRKIILKHLFFGIILFFGIQAFHLLPHINDIFTPGSEINSTIFSDEGKFDRGLSFFSGIAPNIKLSINLLGFPQSREINFLSGVFIVFPALIVFSLFLKKNKTILLTTFLFIVVFFFATANITDIWLSFYKSLFYIPGFNMLRNFYGQWQFAYLFFYSILIGQALYVVLNKLRKKYTYLLLFFLIFIIVANATPLITGDLVRRPLWQSKNVMEIMEIDPDYEKALNFIRSLPADAKVLTLPITDPGYQIVSGKNAGAYMGPSTIAYLAGKKDFAGFEEFGRYKKLISKLIKEQQFDQLRRLFGFLNIKYIFYNADSKVYDEFPGFPYFQVRKFMPKDQKLYKEFVKKIGFEEIKKINNKFYIFELQDNFYLPQVYIAKKTQHFNKEFEEINIPLSVDRQENRVALDNDFRNVPKSYPIKFDEKLIDIQERSSFLDFFINADTTVGFPYAFSAWEMDSIVYPFVVLREKFQLEKYKKIDDGYIEIIILLADKRIGELERWGDNIPVLGSVKSIELLDKSWKEPTIWNSLINRNQYNFWEIGFLRYKRTIGDLIDKLESTNHSLHSLISNKGKLKKAVAADRQRFYTIIEKNEKLLKEEKIYLIKLAISMFDSIMSRLDFEIPSPEKITYSLDGIREGEYEVFIDKKFIEKADESKWQILLNDKKLYLRDFQQDDYWFKGQNIIIKNKADNVLELLSSQSANLISGAKWSLFEERGDDGDATSLVIEDTGIPSSNGLIKAIDNWKSNSYYILSFDYLTYGKNFKITGYDKESKKENYFKTVFEEDLRSSEWKSHKSIFISNNDADFGSILISKSEPGLIDVIDNQGKNSKIELKNISLINVSNPKIILKNIINSKAQDKAFPNVVFTKINPTKYKIDVKNATAPYTLVFTQAFNDKWRLVDLDPKSNSMSFRGDLSRLFASFGNMIGSVFKIGKARNSGTISYFGGEVKENYSQNIFLDENTFNAWAKNEIAFDRHFGSNGYSNAWYIKPDDVGGKKDYTMILELGTQKLFYRSLFISVSVVILCLIFLIVRLLKRSLNEK